LLKKVDIWEFESKKIKLAKDLGYKVLIVWESEYLNNKFKVIKETIEWILKEQQ
jgi:G:T-mismatch repair DNA endonuclease (very short patch repair protein)